MTWPDSGRAPIACGPSSPPRPARSPGNAWCTCSATSGWIPCPGPGAERLVEGHPFAQVLDEPSGLVVTRDYFDSRPSVEDWDYTYTDGPALEHVRSVQFQHGVGEIITALVQAGLRIEFLHEFDFDAIGRFDSLRRQADATYRFPPGRPRVPLIFSVRAALAGPKLAAP
jgi:hypothetical protein